MSLLITGFEAFPGCPVNPSILLAQQVAETLSAEGLPAQSCELPVAFNRIQPALDAALGFDANSPFAAPNPWQAVVLLGVHTGEKLRLETTARNRDHAMRPDNDGLIRNETAIVEGGAGVLPSGLPLDDFARTATEHGLPWMTSDDAGGYLCNHSFYWALSRLKSLSISQPGPLPCGFVHVPHFSHIPAQAQADWLVACLRPLLALPAASTGLTPATPSGLQ